MSSTAAGGVNGSLRRRGIGESLLYGKSMVPALGLLLAILVLFFGLMTKHFFALGTFKAIISNIPVIAVVSIGMTFVLLIGGLDLSVGSILGFTAVNVVLFHDWFEHLGIPAMWLPWLVLLCSLVIGTALGVINGLIITRIGINPVITTLGMMALARGMASWFALGFPILKTGKDHGPDVPPDGEGLPAERASCDHPHHPRVRPCAVRCRDPGPSLHPIREERIRGRGKRVRRPPGGNRRAADQVQHLRHLGCAVGARGRHPGCPAQPGKG